MAPPVQSMYVTEVDGGELEGMCRIEFVADVNSKSYEVGGVSEDGYEVTEHMAKSPVTPL